MEHLASLRRGGVTDLADALSISRPTLHNWLAGRSQPSRYSARRLMEYAEEQGVDLAEYEEETQ